jgi:glycosidase
MKKILFLIFLCISFHAWGADPFEVYPTHWWVGMKNQNLQLLIRGDRVAEMIPVFKLPATGKKMADGIILKAVHHFENPNYVALDLMIDKNAKPGVRAIEFVMPGANFRINYELKTRSKENGTSRVKGVTSEDFVYLLMPDRFSNADPGNDAFNYLRDKEADRNNKYARHGGDLKGIENHFDYLKELGVTTIWCTPLVENDMPKMGEGAFNLAGFHGYWFTDHYKIDKRYGGNEAYKSMIKAAHSKGLKVVHDAVYNHIGLYHWMNQDPPAKDWINQWPAFTGPSHRDASVFDPNKSTVDNNIMLKGWFVRHLPDLNLTNSFVATYLIQNAIWITEEFGFDGFRVDTYKYCDEIFLNNVNTALLKEFPTVTTFVEAWGHDVLANAYFVRNNMKLPFNHNAMGALDFPLCAAMHNSLTQKAEWTSGINELYLTLAKDFVYKEPLNNCIFLDNHDMNRFFSVVGEDLQKFKMGMAMLLTLRGIPHMYYGDEILMKNFKNPTDQEVRLDFPGGFPGDAVNKFEAAGRTPQENETFNYIKTLANFRKKASALKTGKTMQFIPQNGVYVYFRYDAKQTIMCVMNTGDQAATIDLSRFAERMNGFTKAYDVATGLTFNLEPKLTLGEKYLLVMELSK